MANNDQRNIKISTMTPRKLKEDLVVDRVAWRSIAKWGSKMSKTFVPRKGDKLNCEEDVCQF